MKEKISITKSDKKKLKDEAKKIEEKITNTEHADKKITYFIERAVKKAEECLKKN